MSEADTQRLRALIGRQYETTAHEVTRLEIKRFCLAIGETRSIHLDPQAARDAGHRDVVAPASFYASLGFSSRSLVGRDGLAADGLPFEAELEGMRIVAGETQVTFLGTLQSGDQITVRQRLADVYGKSGRAGHMTFLVYERTYERLSGEPVVVERYSRIARR